MTNRGQTLQSVEEEAFSTFINMNGSNDPFIPQRNHRSCRMKTSPSSSSCMIITVPMLCVRVGEVGCVKRQMAPKSMSLIMFRKHPQQQSKLLSEDDLMKSISTWSLFTSFPTQPKMFGYLFKCIFFSFV